MIDQLIEDAVNLLKDLIRQESFSRQEEKTAEIIYNFLSKRNIQAKRLKNNIWAINKYFDKNKPVILLNSHHDTVKPNSGYTKNPFFPVVEDGKLFGLGSNDAGGCLVSLVSTFQYFYNNPNLKYNLIFSATAEEEVSGTDGITLILPELGNIDFAIVGEPTQMNMAVAEKGLMVLDCMAKGVAGHAARNEGKNAIYEALEDILWFKNYKFAKESEFLGPIKMTVSIISAGSAHNVIPDSCKFTVDTRTTDAYTNEEVLGIIKQNVKSEVVPRSTRLRPSFISLDHPIVKAGIKHGCKTFGSPTTSDQSLIPFDSIKIGPGNSERSHSPDEFIFLREIDEGVKTYINILNEVLI